MEEIKNVVFSMEMNTAPGPDHMPIEFFQSCWDFLLSDIWFLFQEFHAHRLDIERLNYGTIILISKLKEANVIQQYRPICLLNIIYKIITKAMMLRREGCMNKIINTAHNAFIKGRNIMEGVMCLSEILHDTRQKKIEGLILKLDFEKAYDKISWNFLMDCLRQRGFD